MKPKTMWIDNVRLRVTDWIGLVPARHRWRILVNAFMKLQVP
jgi:hypothetical protein